MSKRSGNDGGGDAVEPPKKSRRDAGGEAARQHRGNAYTTDARFTGGGEAAAPSQSILTHAAHTQSAADGLGPGTSPALWAFDSTTPPADPALADAHEEARDAEVERYQGEHLQRGEDQRGEYAYHAHVANAAERQLPDSAVPRSGNVDDAVALYRNRLFLDSAGPENAARAGRDRRGANDFSPLRLRAAADFDPEASAEERQFLVNQVHHRAQSLLHGLNPFRHFP